MKIRNGFVSNSSSSSFIVFGHGIGYNDITPKLIKNKKIYAMGGDCLFDGTDFFLINQKMFDLHARYGGALDFYYVDALIEDDGIIQKNDIVGDKIEVSVMEIDIHSIRDEDLATFTERYVDLPPREDPEELRKQANRIEEFQKQLDEEGLEAYVSDGKTRIRKKDEN